MNPNHLIVRRVVVAGASLMLTTLASAQIDARAPAASAAQPADMVAKGRYVSIAAGCQDCHSQKGAAPYSGGEPLKSPFGDIYPPNVTPATKTGIGDWTLEDFGSALRQGRSKGGGYLYPAMPYVHYTKMTDDDVASLWAYMKTIKPVEKETPKNKLPFPLNIRTGIAAWQALYLNEGRFEATAGKSDAWNRGAYLVDAMGHCSSCHTPRNFAMATKTDQRLTGAQIENWYAPDISNDPLSSTEQFSVDALASYLKTGRTGKNIKVFGPMSQVVHESLGLMTDSDLHAMAVYLKDLPDGNKPRDAVAEKSLTPQMLASGQQTYTQHCENCHQSGGGGIQGSVPALAGNSALVARRPDNVITAVLQGFEPQGTWGVMPAFAKTLTNGEIAAVTNYVRASWGNRSAALATPQAVQPLREKADVPQAGQQATLICPNPPASRIEPALKAGPDKLEAAADDPKAMASLVADYQKSLPKSSAAETIESLSTAYCRVVTGRQVSQTRAGAKVASFAQRVAVALSER